MKKWLALFLAMTFTIGISACGNETNSTTEETSTTLEESTASIKEKIDISKMSDEDIINKFIEAGFPISKIIVYNEETDVNELLGRPNQYIQKTNFADARYEQYDIDNDPIGGTIEIFNNTKDAQARKNYLDSVYESYPGITTPSYMYLRNNILFRIHSELTPTHAKEYEAGLDALINGEMPTFTSSETTQNEEDSPKDTGAINSKYTISIKDHILTTDESGKEIIIINYDFTNTGEEGTSFSSAISIKAFQDGIQLSNAYLYNNEYYNDENNFKEIKTGATITVQTAYKLDSLTSPVEIEVTDLLDFSGNSKILTKTFTL